MIPAEAAFDTGETVKRIHDIAEYESVALPEAARIWRDGNQAGFEAGVSIAFLHVREPVGAILRMLADAQTPLEVEVRAAIDRLDTDMCFRAEGA